MSNRLFIFFFLNSTRQWTWVEGLTGTSPSSEKANTKSCSGYGITWCSCAAWAQTGCEAALQKLMCSEGQVKMKVSNPSLGSIRRAQLSGRTWKAISLLCSVLLRLQLECCDQFWAPEDKIHIGTSPVEATEMLRRLEHRSRGDRRWGLVSLENRKLGSRKWKGVERTEPGSS